MSATEKDVDEVFSGLITQTREVTVEEKVRQMMGSLLYAVKDKQWGDASLYAWSLFQIVTSQLLDEKLPGAYKEFKDGSTGRFFKDQIFHGNGHRSTAEIGLLYFILDRALSHIGGCQQVTGRCSLPSGRIEKMFSETQECIENAREDVKAALGDVK